LCTGETHRPSKLHKGSEIEFCQEYKYLAVIFDTRGTDDKEIRSRVIKYELRHEPPVFLKIS